MYRTPLTLKQLDDRIMELHRIDQAIQLGRLEGITHQMQKEVFFRGEGELPKFDRTPEYRLQMHYEREYRRLTKESR